MKLVYTTKTYSYAFINSIRKRKDVYAIFYQKNQFTVIFERKERWYEKGNRA